MKFFSKYPQGLYTLVSERVRYDNFGQRIGTTPGKEVKFVDGVYETDDKEEIKMIMALREYGIEITSEGKNEISRDAVRLDNAEKSASEDVGATGCPHCSFKAGTPQALKIHVKEKHDK